MEKIIILVLAVSATLVNSHSVQQGQLLIATTDNNSLQLTHRLDLKDAEQLLANIAIADSKVDLTECNKHSQYCAAIAGFLATKINYYIANKPIRLQAVGYEVENFYAYFYFEYPSFELPITIDLANIKSKIEHFGYIVKLQNNKKVTTKFLGLQDNLVTFN